MAEETAHNRRYQQLKVWQAAMALAREIYGITGKFPLAEREGLARQLRQVAVSIPTILAKGSERTRTELMNHIEQARAALAELETLWILAKELKFTEADSALDEPIEQLAVKLNAYLRTVEGGH